jgi:ABC-type nitrate/sulfonate/bicarbonate transport system permease component
MYEIVLLAVAGVLALPGLASATPYAAPPVTPAPQAWAPVSDPSEVAYSSTTSLASTGAGFSVGTAVAIGIAVLLVGVALIMVGRFARRSQSH